MIDLTTMMRSTTITDLMESYEDPIKINMQKQIQNNAHQML